jgi:hypothetical protein
MVTSPSALLMMVKYDPKHASAVIKPYRPQRCSRAAANTVTVPMMVVQIEFSQP